MASVSGQTGATFSRPLMARVINNEGSDDGWPDPSPVSVKEFDFPDRAPQIEVIEPTNDSLEGPFQAVNQGFNRVKDLLNLEGPQAVPEGIAQYAFPREFRANITHAQIFRELEYLRQSILNVVNDSHDTMTTPKLIPQNGRALDLAYATREIEALQQVGSQHANEIANTRREADSAAAEVQEAREQAEHHRLRYEKCFQDLDQAKIRLDQQVRDQEVHLANMKRQHEKRDSENMFNIKDLEAKHVQMGHEIDARTVEMDSSMDDLKRQHEREMQDGQERHRYELRTQQEDLEQQHENQVRDSRESQQNEFRLQSESLRQEHAKILHDKLNEHKDELQTQQKSLKQEHEKAMYDSRSLHQDELRSQDQNLEQQHETKLHNSQEQHQNELLSLQKDLEQTQERHEIVVADMRKWHGDVEQEFVLQQAKKDKAVESLRTKQDDQLLAQRESHEKEVALKDAELAHLVERSRSEFQSLEKEHDQRLASLNASQQDLATSHQRQLQSKDNELVDLAETHEIRTKDIISQHQQHLTSLAASHQQQTQSKDKELTDLVEMHDTRIKDVHAQHQQHLASLAASHQEALKSKDRILTDLGEKHDIEMRSIDAKHQSRLKDLAVSQEDQLASKQSEVTKLRSKILELSELSEKQTNDMTTMNEESQNRLQNMMTVHEQQLYSKDAELSQLTKNHEGVAGQLRSDHENEQNILQGKLNDSERRYVEQTKFIGSMKHKHEEYLQEVMERHHQGLRTRDEQSGNLSEQTERDLQAVKTQHKSEVLELQQRLQTLEARLQAESNAKEEYASKMEVQTRNLKVETDDKLKEQQEIHDEKLKSWEQQVLNQLAGVQRYHERQINEFRATAEARHAQLEDKHSQSRRSRDIIEITLRYRMKLHEEAAEMQRIELEDRNSQDLTESKISFNIIETSIRYQMKLYKEAAEAQSLQNKEEYIRNIKEVKSSSNDTETALRHQLKMQSDAADQQRRQLEAQSNSVLIEQETSSEIIEKALRYQLVLHVANHESDQLRIRQKHSQEIAMQKHSQDIVETAMRYRMLLQENNATKTLENAEQNHLRTFLEKLSNVREEHESKIAQTREIHHQEIQGIQQEHDSNVQTLEHIHRQDLTKIQQSSDATLNEFERHLDELREQYSTNRNATAQQHDTKIKELDESHQRQLQDVERVRDNAAITQQEEQMNLLRLQHDTELSELEQSHQLELDQMDASGRESALQHQHRLDEMIESQTSMKTELEQTYDKRLASVEEEHNEVVSALNSLHKEQFDDLQRSMDRDTSQRERSLHDEILRKDSMIRQLHLEHEKALSVANSKSDATLRETSLNHENRVKQLRDDHESKIHSMQEHFDQFIDRKNTEMQNQGTGTRETYQLQVEQFQHQREKELQEIRRQHEVDMTRLQEGAALRFDEEKRLHHNQVQQAELQKTSAIAALAASHNQRMTQARQDFETTLQEQKEMLQQAPREMNQKSRLRIQSDEDPTNVKNDEPRGDVPIIGQRTPQSARGSGADTYGATRTLARMNEEATHSDSNGRVETSVIGQRHNEALENLRKELDGRRDKELTVLTALISSLQAKLEDAMNKRHHAERVRDAVLARSSSLSMPSRSQSRPASAMISKTSQEVTAGSINLAIRPHQFEQLAGQYVRSSLDPPAPDRNHEGDGAIMHTPAKASPIPRSKSESKPLVHHFTRRIDEQQFVPPGPLDFGSPSPIQAWGRDTLHRTQTNDSFERPKTSSSSFMLLRKKSIDRDAERNFGLNKSRWATDETIDDDERQPLNGTSNGGAMNGLKNSSRPSRSASGAQSLAERQSKAMRYMDTGRGRFRS